MVSGETWIATSTVAPAAGSRAGYLISARDPERDAKEEFYSLNVYGGARDVPWRDGGIA
jgi:hypothetical protein